MYIDISLSLKNDWSKMSIYCVGSSDSEKYRRKYRNNMVMKK